MSSRNQARKIITPTPQELQALFNLSSDAARAPRQSVALQGETLADPEAWVRDFLGDLDNPPIDLESHTPWPLNNAQRWSRISEQQRLMLTSALPAAIRALRKKRGESQYVMGMKTGFAFGALANWERGKAMPSGLALLMLLRLCPDAESLANFGLNFRKVR